MASNGKPPFLRMEWHDDADLALKDPENNLILLTGIPGCGKSMYAKTKARQITGREPEIIDGAPGFEERHLFGKTHLVGTKAGATVTVDGDGPLVRAIRHNAWLVVEEFSLIPAEMRSYFLALRGQQQIVNPLTDACLDIPDNFRLIATSNYESLTCKRSGGATRALLDGFLIIDIPEPTEKDVEAWLRFHYPRAAKAKIDFVIEKWMEYREIVPANDRDGRQYLSYRAAAQLLRLIEVGMNPEKAIHFALIGKYICEPDLYSTAKLRASIV